jgi:hypothetical protein
MDFKHRTQRVGKRKLAPLNETRLSLKIARLQNPSGLSILNESTSEASAAQANLRETLSRMRNHNAAMRRDAVSALLSIMSNNSGDEKRRQQIQVLLQTNAHSVLTSVAERLVDTEPAVRSQLLPVTASIFSQLSASAALPHLPIFCAFLVSALSQLHVSVRLDALAIVAEIIRVAPTLTQRLAMQILAPVSSLLDPQLHAMVTSSLFSSIVPQVLGLSSELRPSHSPNSASLGASNALVSRTKLGNKETRICCVFVYRQLLLGGEESLTTAADAETSSFDEGKNTIGFGGNRTISSSYTFSSLTKEKGKPSVQANGFYSAPLPLVDGIRFSISTCNDLDSLQTQQRGTSLDTIMSKKPADSSVSSFSKSASDLLSQPNVLNIFNHLIQLWLDCGGGESHCSDDSSSSLYRLSLIVQTVRLVLEKISFNSSQNSGNVEDPLLPLQDSYGVIAFSTQGKQDGATGKDAPVLDRESALRSVMRALSTYIFAPFPMQTSSVVSNSNTNNETSTAIALLNMRIAELACSTLPDIQAIGKAREILLHAGIINTEPNTFSDSATGASENPFGVLSRKRTDEQQTSPTSATNAKNKLPVAWRKYISSMTHLDRALKSYEALVNRLSSFCADKLEALIKMAGRGMDDRKQNSSLVSSLPSLLSVLSCILVHVDDQLRKSLLQMADSLFNACPPRTKAKTIVLSFILQVMSSDHHSDHFNVKDLERSWVQGFPRLLVALGISDVIASTRILKTLLDRSQRAQKMSPEDLGIKGAMRQMTPLLYATKAGSEAQTEGDEESTYGPFIDYPSSLQRLFLALLHSSSTFTPSMIHALSVLARNPRVGHEERSRIIEVTILSLLTDSSDSTELMQFEHSTPSTRLDIGVCSATAFLLTLVLARPVEPSTLLGGPQLIVKPSSGAFRGQIQSKDRIPPGTIFIGLYKALEQKEEPSTLDADSAYSSVRATTTTTTSLGTGAESTSEETLDICAKAFRLLSGKCQKESLKRMVLEVMGSIIGVEGDEPTIRKAASSLSMIDNNALSVILESLS